MTRTVDSKTKVTADSTKTIKFLYSYGGKILPRRTDGKLRYVGGFTRVLAVDRCISFADLMVKLGELCGSSVSLKCKLPSEDLDVLISITCDEDLANLIDEYDRFSVSTKKETKITVLLFPLKSSKKIAPVSSVEDLCSPGSSAGSSEVASPPCSAAVASSSFPVTAAAAYSGRCYHPRYRHQNQYRCRGGASPRHTCYVPSSNYYCS